MRRRSQAFFCPIAGKAVGIALRHGTGVLEPATRYVRCDERDCQYVDLNQPPCPLRVDMFADKMDDALRTYLAKTGRRMCYRCLTEKFEITHDQLRRAVWAIREADGCAIAAARCAACGERRMTISVAASA